jgi:hypothetical protein
MIFCGGVYALFFRNKIAGLLIIYTSMVAFASGLSIQTAVVLISLIATYLALTYYEGNREIVYDFIIVVAAANLAFQIGQATGHHWITYPQECIEHWPGLMANRNETSALYAIAGACCLRKHRYYFLVIIITGLLLSVSLGGVIAFCGMMIIWTVRHSKIIPVIRAGKYKSRKYIFPSLMISVIVGFIMFYGIVVHPFNIEGRKTERFYVWETTVRAAMLKPFGWGFGQYEIVIPLVTSWKYLSENNRYSLFQLIKDKETYNQVLTNESARDKDFLTGTKQKASPFIQAHNDFIEYFFATGYPGIILALLFLVSTLWRSYKSVDAVPFYGIIAASLSAITFFTFQIIPTAVLTVLYLAWAKEKQWRAQKIYSGQQQGYIGGGIGNAYAQSQLAPTPAVPKETSDRRILTQAVDKL